MIRIGKILYPTDFSRCSRQALNHALYLAEQFGAELHMLHAVVLHQDEPAGEGDFPGAADLLERLMEIAASEMARLTEQSDGRALEIREFRTRGFSAAGVILDHVREHDVDLVVMGTHGRRGPARMFFGSAAEETVRFSPCPVLTLRETVHERDIEAIQRVLVPIDFSPHAQNALAHARHLAHASGARLELLHVVEQPIWPHFYSTFAGFDAAEAVTELEARAVEALDGLIAGTPGPDVEHASHVIRGRAADAIVEFAGEHDSDLIVMASHGLTGLEHLLLGSCAQQVVRTSPIPVFLTKPFGRSLLESRKA